MEWLNFLLEHFLTPWGYTLNGCLALRHGDLQVWESLLQYIPDTSTASTEDCYSVSSV